MVLVVTREILSLISTRASCISCLTRRVMSCVSCPNSSPMLRSSALSAGIAASTVPAATTGLALPLELGVLRELVVPAVAESLGAAIILGFAAEAAVPLRALQEPGAHKPEDERSPEHQGRLAPRKILQIVSHRHGVLIS